MTDSEYFDHLAAALIAAADGCVQGRAMAHEQSRGMSMKIGRAHV